MILKLSNFDNKGAYQNVCAYLLSGHCDVVKFLLDQGSDVSAADNSGLASLHSAVHEGHLEVVRLLISEGADHSARNSNGETALHIAAFK